MLNENPSNALHSKLIHFGLNPQDWFLTPQANNRWLIENTEQEELKFIGLAEIRQTAWDWKQIHLAFS